MAKNSSLLSNYAFAFRADRNSMMAAKHVIDAVRSQDRVFLVEYDFKSFFDRISHVYLLKMLDTHFVVTATERALIKSFLKGSYALGLDAYRNANFKPRSSGIPQGCTLSLFLANAVCFELDKDLEATDACFARFADDVVVVCQTYDQACKAASAIHRFSRASGVPINVHKSDGISLLSQSPGEIRSKPSFDFLGYNISQRGVKLSARRKLAIKRALSQIVYETLLRHLKAGQLSASRIVKGADWDLVVCLNQLRKRIYGRGLTEQSIGAPVSSRARAPWSIIASHALVSTHDDLVELDGWLLGALSRALWLRHCLARRHKLKFSLKLTRKALVENVWYKVSALPMETTVPSLTRSWLYARKLLAKRGAPIFPSRYSSY